MKLSVLQDERFTCQSCTNCCRNWHVELIGEEIARIPRLSWPANDPLGQAKVILPHAGKSFLAHRADGTCVFLNLANGLCRIHEQFGANAKPLGCRLYPFQIRRTFNGQATVTARFDCPKVRQNQGEPHANELPNLRRIADQLSLGPALDESVSCNLSAEQMRAICDFAGTMINGLDRDDQRALFIHSLANLLAMADVDQIDREGLAAVYPGLRKLVLDLSSGPAKPPGMLARVSFRSLLGQYLRRDEEVLDQRAGRFARTLAMIKLTFGFGNFRGLGLSHPAGSIRRARLFRSTLQPQDANTFALFWRMIRTKLDTLQFIGSANGDRNFYQGLQSLALLYPLTFAVAKYAAANRGADGIELPDVDCAVATIEHSFGRLATLNEPHARSLERALLHSETFVKMVRAV